MHTVQAHKCKINNVSISGYKQTKLIIVGVWIFRNMNIVQNQTNFMRYPVLNEIWSIEIPVSASKHDEVKLLNFTQF